MEDELKALAAKVFGLDAARVGVRDFDHVLPGETAPIVQLQLPVTARVRELVPGLAEGDTAVVVSFASRAQAMERLRALDPAGV